MADTPDRLAGQARAFVVAARRAILATIAPDGRPRPVPVCFELVDERLWIPIDDKPKRSSDPMDLARVRDVIDRPGVSLLVDRWDEDWSRLWWVRIDGRADVAGIDAPEHGRVVAALRAKYPPYAIHDLEHRPLIRIAIERVVTWGVPDR